MALGTGQVSVGTTATALDRTLTPAPAKHSSLVVRNRGTAAVFLGTAAVTTTTGLQLDAGETITISADMFPLGVYGIVASGTVTVHVLQVGV